MEWIGLIAIIGFLVMIGNHLTRVERKIDSLTRLVEDLHREHEVHR